MATKNRKYNHKHNSRKTNVILRKNRQKSKNPLFLGKNTPISA